MTDPDRPTFKLLDQHGNVIMHGDMAAVTEPILDSTSRRVAERLVRDAAIAAGQVAEINARADAVIERERQVEEREQALHADAIRRFCDGVLELEHRVDAYERAQARAALDALPDPDHPQDLSRAQQDDWLPPSRLEAPHPTDKQQLEAMLASEREADDADDAGPGDLPEELRIEQPSEPVPELAPAGSGTRMVASDRRRFREPKPPRGSVMAQPTAVSLNSDRADALGRNFVCARDRRPWQKQMRAPVPRVVRSS
jgi:hypothetical protein